MKKIYCLAFFIALSCTNKPKETEKTEEAKQKVSADTIETTIQTEKKGNPKYYTKLDTIAIPVEIDTMRYVKADFNRIIDEHPELYQEFPAHPDLLYYSLTNSGDFSSEVGQDNYYILYAYFLKQKNGEKKYAKQRKKLIDIFSNINSLFRQLQYGGTYFAHKYPRILGYAEYSVYRLPKEDDIVEKTYDISKQKLLYIKSLRQLIADESKIDFESLGKEKMERTNKLNELVDELDILITNLFYLREAQDFQYSHYKYY
jgi:hypothetical protein